LHCQEEQIKLRDEIKEMHSAETQMQQKIRDMEVSAGAMKKRIDVADSNIAKLTYVWNAGCFVQQQSILNKSAGLKHKSENNRQLS